MKTMLIAALAFVSVGALAQTGPTATFSHEALGSTVSEVGPNDVDYSFDVRNDGSAPIGTIGMQCFLRYPDRKPPIASMKAKYTFQHVVNPGETRHEDLVINPFSEMGQAAQSIPKGATFDCRTLFVVTSDGDTITAAAMPESPAVATSVSGSLGEH